MAPATHGPGLGGRRATRPGVALALLALSTLLAMSVWFSATVVLTQLEAEWSLGGGRASLLTIAVQVGFVVGALASAVLGLADAVPARTLMGLGAFGAAGSNALLLLADGLAAALPLRLLTGLFLAAYYPVALKEIATWSRGGRGTALGLIIGALTLGSALPHLLTALAGTGAGPGWRGVIATTSALSAAGGLVLLAVRGEGPCPFPRGPVSLGSGFRALRHRDVLLANLGYVGHMWELYAMWAGVGAFLITLPTVAERPNAVALAAYLTFGCIGIGAAGCLVGGLIGDRWGRPRAALLALVCSGGAALTLAATYDVVPLGVVVAMCAWWGFWVIADSAQFSAMVTEHAPAGSIGGALSVQLALGFLTTTLTLWLVPTLVERASWHVALAVLAAGPAAGAGAMLAAERRRRAGRLHSADSSARIRR